LKEIHFGLILRFTSTPIIDLFVRHYEHVLCEFGFTLGLDEISEPIINSLNKFTRLQSLTIVYYNHQASLTLELLTKIGQQANVLRRLTIYRSFDVREDHLFDMFQLNAIFRKLNYYYLGPLIAGMWANSAYQKSTMCDMTK